MDTAQLTNLMRAAAYPEPTGSVRLIQTHVSFIFVTDDFVYKIKKAVDLGFLNFTTIDRRRFYCGEEVRLNRRLCPDTYLGVVEVRESADGATLCGDGKVIDYAVKMKRLPEELMMDRMLDAGRVTGDDILRIARAVARFHLGAERGGRIDGYGDLSVIRGNWEENFQQAERFIGKTISAGDMEIIRRHVSGFMDGNRRLFAERVEEGFIRDCDGDIHMENICLTEPVRIFDCIEFNDRFRFTDTAADIAFFLMDLDFHGAGSFAPLFMEEYQRLTGDSRLPLLLGFYKTYRAFVRGKVESLKILDPEIAEHDKGLALVKGRRYFRLARGYVLREGMAKSLIITCGLMGSGKSAIAAAVAFELGLEVLSSDLLRKEMAGLSPGEKSVDDYGTGIYTPDFDRAVYGALLSRCEGALRGGKSVIADATFRRRSDREAFAALARRCGAEFIIVHPFCDEETARERLERREEAPMEVSDGRWPLYRRQKEEFSPPSTDEGMLIPLDTVLPLEDNIDRTFAAMEIINGE